MVAQVGVEEFKKPRGVVALPRMHGAAEVPQQPEPLENAPGAKGLDPAGQFLAHEAKAPQHLLAADDLGPRMGHGQEMARKKYQSSSSLSIRTSST